MQNNTYNNIINQVKPIKAWVYIKDNINKLYLRPTKNGNYGIFFDETFTGIFIGGCSVDLNELSKTNIKFNKNKME